MTTSKQFSPYRSKSTKTPSLMLLDSGHYHFLSEVEFVLLARIAVLTNNGEHPCDYSNAQGMKEFNFPQRTIERAFANLRKFNLVQLSRGHSLSKHRGRTVRIVTLCSNLVVFKKRA